MHHIGIPLGTFGCVHTFRLSALLFAEICAEAGLPPGVFNVITGGGAMGQKLAEHWDVDKVIEAARLQNVTAQYVPCAFTKVGFTGSTEIGKVLKRATAGTGKKISLELGGKLESFRYILVNLIQAEDISFDARKVSI